MTIIAQIKFKKVKIFYDGNFVGSLEDPRPDMWYIEGEWFPEQSEYGKNFDRLFRLQDLKGNFSNSGGVLIGWSENEEILDGLALGITGNLFIFRRLSEQAKEILLKEGKIINL